MSEYKVTYTSIYHIDLDTKSLDEKGIKQGDLEEYTKELIKETIEGSEDKVFDITSKTTEVISLIFNFFNDKGKFEECSLAIAERLLRVEIETQEKYEQITDIQKGSLIQSVLENNNNKYYIITKVEHSAFLDGEELTKRMGLPFEKRMLKTCLIEFNDSNEVMSITVNDSNNKISNYWWNSFLELKQLNSDEQNTVRAFKAIEHYLSKNLAENSPVDYTLLRNNTVGYFKTQEDFTMDSFINNIIGNYIPEDKLKVDTDKIKGDVRELSKKKKFDEKFSIIKDKVNVRIKNRVKISENIYLDINDYIEGIKGIIKPIKEKNGDKYLLIKVQNEKAFELFNFKNQKA